MKVISIALSVFFLCLILIVAGCAPVPPVDEPPVEAQNGTDVSIYTYYAPVKIEIIPLTEITCVDDAEKKCKIKAYVSLLDSFGCQEKSPGVFRFELYNAVQRSAEPKGRRVVIWPDIDLTDPAQNNSYWRDFLRAYAFDLDFEPEINHNYVLQVTCICPSGKRLSGVLEGLRYAE